jgi:hypothetical protein
MSECLTIAEILHEQAREIAAFEVCCQLWSDERLKMRGVLSEYQSPLEENTPVG